MGIVTSMVHIESCKTNSSVQEVKAVEQEEFEGELMYRIALSAARSMQKRGLVTKEEYGRIDRILLEKYYPVLGRLLAGKPFVEEVYENRGKEYWPKP